jgi:gliding motility-associated-like protein
MLLYSTEANAQACNCTVSQDGANIPLSTLVGTTDVNTWFAYDANGATSSNTGLEQADGMVVTLYEDNNGQVSLVIMLDDRTDGTGGSETVTVDCLNGGSFVAFSNDNGEAAGAAPQITGNFEWGPPNNDGMIIGGITCPMTISIDASYSAVNGAAVVDGTVAAPNIIGLPGQGLITINCGGGACCPTTIVNEVNIVNATCPNSTDGQVIINPNELSGIGPWTYIWDNINGIDNQLTGVGAGLYCVTVTDSQGCMEENCYQVFASNPSPQAFPAGPLTGCSDPFTGQALFDLTTLNSTVNGGSGNQVLWYQDDLLFVQIQNPEGYFSDGFFPVYAVVSNGQCLSDPVEVQLNVEQTPFAAPAILSECEESNGQAVFDLTEAEDAVGGGFGIVEWYEDEMLNTQIGDPTNYLSATDIVYAVVIDNTTIGMCASEPVEVDLIVLPSPEGMPDTLISCANVNGMGTFNLSEATPNVNTDNGDLLWYEDDMQMNPIGADSTAYMTGNDTVYAFITLNGCVSDPVPVYLNIIEVMPGPADSLSLCDDGNGMATFNLAQLEPTLIGAGDSIQWFEDNMASMQITDPSAFTSNATTVYYIIFEDGCASPTSPVELFTLPTPLVQTDTLTACDIGDGTGIYNLNNANIITNGVGTLSWYIDPAGTAPVADPSNYNAPPGVVYVQAEEDTCSSPIIAVTLELTTVEGVSDSLRACGDANAMASFDLSSITSTINTSMGSVSWFEDDMQNTAILDTTNYVSETDTVYAFITIDSCVSEPVPVFLNVTFVPAGPADTVYLCDDGAGFADFDLTLLEPSLATGVDSLNWFEDDMATLPISNPAAYNTDTANVYYVLYNMGCPSEPSSVTLYPLPTPTVQSDTLLSCDEGDGTGIYDLDDALIITNGIGSVSWFEDAAGTVPITGINNYNTVPTTVYAQATLDTCSSPLVPVELELIAAVTATTDTIELCGDGAGMATFNLTSINGSVSSGTGTTNWFSDMAGTMPIPTPSSFTSGTVTVYANVTAGNCSSGIVPVELIVIPLPVAMMDTQMECEDITGIATFDLTASDAAVSAGQGAVSWFLDNAVTMPVGTPTMFTSDVDTTVYALVDDGTCISLPVAVALQVLPLPATMPDTLINCDNGNGTAPFDLTTANVTTTPGTTITWYQDAAATMMIFNTTGYQSAGETVYAVVDDGNCSAPPVAVELEVIFAQAPDLTCFYTAIDSVAFSWDMVADSFSVTYQVNNGPVVGPIIVLDTLFGLGGLMESDLVSVEVTSLIDPLCTAGITSTESCTADACQPIPFTFDNLLSEYCSDEAPFLLVASPAGGTFSGPGVSNDTLYPGMLSGTSFVFYDYFEASTMCDYRDSMEITVFEPLDSVDITCSNITVNDITFSWNDVGADAYQIELLVDNVPQPTVTSTNLDTVLTGLADETEVMITVTPLGSPPCGNGPASSETCTTDPCPPTSLSSDFLADEYCSDTSGIDLPDLYPGGIYAGPGVNGTQFDPDGVGMASAIISFSYTDTMTGCPYILEDTVALIDPLLPPAITCDSVSPNSVTFTWEGGNPDGYQYYYQIENNPPTTIVTTSDSSVFIGNMNETETVTIYVSALGQDPCGNSVFDSLSCSSTPCPLVNVILSNLDTAYCIDDAPVTLDIMPAGGTFSGDGINGNDFDPSIAGVGPVTIVYNYTDTLIDCSYSATFTTEVFDTLVPPVITCGVSTPSSVSFSWDDVGATAYLVEWTIDNNPGGDSLLTGTSLEITGLLSEQVVGITITAQGPDPCGNATPSTAECTSAPCPDIIFDFTAPSPVCSEDGTLLLEVNVIGSSPTGQVSWSGDGIQDNSGTFDPTMAIVGNNNVMISYMDGVCSYDTTVVVYVHPEPEASFTVEGSFCSDSTLVLTFDGTATDSATFNWMLDGGTIVQQSGDTLLEVSWPAAGNYEPSLVIEDNGCISDTFSVPVELIAPLIPPVITCEVLNYTSISFSWNAVEGADNYQVTTTNGTGVLNDTTYLVTGLMPGDTATVTVTAIGATPCGPVTSELTCNTEPCPDISFEFTAPTPVCSVDGPIGLTVNVVNSNPEGVITWSGDGIQDNSGTFDPTMAIVGDNMITITYDEEGVCIFDTTVVVNVHPEPVASFTVDGSFCSDSTLVLTFDGMATDSATFNWMLDGGTIVQQSGDTLLEVSWPMAGNYNLSLFIEDNGCVSETFDLPVELIAPLIPPVISCDPQDNTSILFTWDPIAGATEYQVSTTNGTGTLNGTSYLVTGLMPEEMTTVTVIAIGATPCGPVSSEFSCSTPPCPEVSLSLDAPTDICSGEDITVSFTINGVAGDFEVQYQINQGATQTAILANGEELNFTNVTEDFTLDVIDFFASGNDACLYTGGQSISTQVMMPPNAGSSSLTPAVCIGTDSTIQLFSLLTGADAGGSWTVNGPAAPGFDMANGTLSTSNLPANTYTFLYTVSGNGICPDARTEVNVIVNGLPTVDAGETQEISCDMGMVSIGSSANPSGSGISYLWTTETPGVVINNPTGEFIDVSQPGTYTLTITNEFGCSNADDVVVTASLDAPIAFITPTSPSCFGDTDGSIIIDSISGGVPPYTTTVNGQVSSGQSSFFNLAPGTYDITIEGANGCFTQQSFTLIEPVELTAELAVDLEEEEALIFGNSTLISSVITNTVPIDTFIWSPEGEGPSFLASPESTTFYNLTVVDENGCSAEAQILVIVEKVRDVYVPNVFSPNEDGRNDIFYIQSGAQVQSIKTFQVFNRWGETVFEASNFPPNDPNFGWDGNFRGEFMNAAVFTWFAEVEFIDGVVEIIKGDVILLR